MVFGHFSLLLFFRRIEGRGWVNYEDHDRVTFERIFHKPPHCESAHRHFLPPKAAVAHPAPHPPDHRPVEMHGKNLSAVASTLGLISVSSISSVLSILHRYRRKNREKTRRYFFYLLPNSMSHKFRTTPKASPTVSPVPIARPPASSSSYRLF